MLEKASYIFPVPKGSTSLCTVCFGELCCGEAGWAGLHCQGKQGDCDLHALAWVQWADVLVPWVDGWVAVSLFFSSSLPARSRDLVSGRWDGWGRFVRPQGIRNGVILPLSGLCPQWLKIFFPRTYPAKLEGFCKFIMSLRNLFNQLPFPGGNLHLMRDMMEGIKTGLQELASTPPAEVLPSTLSFRGANGGTEQLSPCLCRLAAEARCETLSSVSHCSFPRCHNDD